MTDVAEAASFVANAQGGVIVVGVGDGRSGSGAYEEVTLDSAAVLRCVWELTSPSLVVEVSERRHQGNRLLMIAVPRSPDVHQVKGKATERIGAACEPMSARRIAAVLADRRGDDWSAIDAGIPASAADDRSMSEARRLL